MYAFLLRKVDNHIQLAQIK